jgi:hypothetical protein
MVLLVVELCFVAVDWWFMKGNSQQNQRYGQHMINNVSRQYRGPVWQQCQTGNF